MSALLAFSITGIILEILKHVDSIDDVMKLKALCTVTRKCFKESKPEIKIWTDIYDDHICVNSTLPFSKTILFWKRGEYDKSRITKIEKITYDERDYMPRSRNNIPKCESRFYFRKYPCLSSVVVNSWSDSRFELREEFYASGLVYIQTRRTSDGKYTFKYLLESKTMTMEKHDQNKLVDSRFFNMDITSLLNAVQQLKVWRLSFNYPKYKKVEEQKRHSNKRLKRW